MVWSITALAEVAEADARLTRAQLEIPPDSIEIADATKDLEQTISDIARQTAMALQWVWGKLNKQV